EVVSRRDSGVYPIADRFSPSAAIPSQILPRFCQHNSRIILPGPARPDASAVDQNDLPHPIRVCASQLDCDPPAERMSNEVGALHVESIHNAKHQLCVVRNTPRCRWESTFSMTGEIDRQDRVMAREIVKHQPHALDRATPAMEEQHVLSYTSHFVAYF